MKQPLLLKIRGAPGSIS